MSSIGVGYVAVPMSSDPRWKVGWGITTEEHWYKEGCLSLQDPQLSIPGFTQDELGRYHADDPKLTRSAQETLLKSLGFNVRPWVEWFWVDYPDCDI